MNDDISPLYMEMSSLYTVIGRIDLLTQIGVITTLWDCKTQKTTLLYTSSVILHENSLDKLNLDLNRKSSVLYVHFLIIQITMVLLCWFVYVLNPVKHSVGRT